MILYHATRQPAYENARKIVAEGFRGNDVWELEDAVFLADKPLAGFGGWMDCWVAIDVPEEKLILGNYEDQKYDNEQYECNSYAFKSDIINQFDRWVVDNVD